MPEGLGFYIGKFFVAYYGLMIVTGLAAAVAVGWYQVRRFGKNFDDFVLMGAIVGLFGMIGAKALYIVVSLDQIDFHKLADLAYLNTVMSGGFVFYGGLAGGILGGVFCWKVFRLDVHGYLEIAAPCLPVAHGFGRIGCSLAGCCYGRPYHGIGAVIYQHSLIAPNHQPLFPVQLAESVLNFSIAAVLLLYIDKFSKKKGFELYLMLYAAVRFLLEFFRYDDLERGMFAGLSTSQYISLGILILVPLYLWVSHLRRTPKAHRPGTGA